MHWQIITLFPDMFQASKFGVVGRAIDKQLIQMSLINPRDYTDDPHRTVDDRPYGGGPGMVMKYQPVHQAIMKAKQNAVSAQPKVIYLSPQGKPFNQQAASEFAQCEDMILLCGRYEGIDQRIIEQDIDEQWSIGDYVLSGGEIAAMTIIDAVCRLIPDVLGHEQSAQQDSFSNDLLDHPHYTRPEQIAGLSVPEVLLSGDHEAIRRWRLQQSLGKTWQTRPDLIKRRILSAEEQQLLEEYIQNASRTDS